MPTYHYRCSDCGHSFDFFQKFAEDPLTECPECKGPIRRIPQPVGIVFKGSGWYVNDARDAKKSTAVPASETSEKKSDDSKPAAKEPRESKDTPEKKPAAAVKES